MTRSHSAFDAQRNNTRLRKTYARVKFTIQLPDIRTLSYIGLTKNKSLLFGCKSANNDNVVIYQLIVGKPFFLSSALGHPEVFFADIK